MWKTLHLCRVQMSSVGGSKVEVVSKVISEAEGTWRLCVGVGGGDELTKRPNSCKTGARVGVGALCQVSQAGRKLESETIWRSE